MLSLLSIVAPIFALILCGVLARRWDSIGAAAVSEINKFVVYLALPALQLLAVGLNFAMMIVASRPAFNLPFHSMKDVTETRELLETFHLTPRKQPGI